eukprot:gene7311-8093_t
MGNCCCEALAACLDWKTPRYHTIPDDPHALDPHDPSQCCAYTPSTFTVKTASHSTLLESPSAGPAGTSAAAATAASTLPLRLQLPSEFHKFYELGKPLGIGTTSKVFTVHRKKRRKAQVGSHGPIKDLACKMIDKRKLTFGMEARDIQPLLQQLRKEVDILRRVNHPNIVTYVDFLESRDKILIITERLPGGELFDHLINEGCLSEEQARETLYGVFSAVAYLHDRGVIHRDIKAENLIFFTHLNGKQSLKMIDFGFSTILKHDLTGSFLGTGGYIAPEIRQNKMYSTSVDNWALGVLMYCTLSTKLPFPVSVDPLPIDKEECQKLLRLRFPNRTWATISDNCKDLIIRLLEIDPIRRLTAKEALQHPWFRPVSGSTPNSLSGKGRRIVGHLSGFTHSFRLSIHQDSEKEESLKREEQAMTEEDDDIHNPYWELPSLQSDLRRSMSMLQLERRRSGKHVLYSKTLPSATSTSNVINTPSKETDETNSPCYLVGGDSQDSDKKTPVRQFRLHSDGSLLTEDMLSREETSSKTEIVRRVSFCFDETHDHLAGDLFYSTYFNENERK